MSIIIINGDLTAECSRPIELSSFCHNHTKKTKMLSPAMHSAKFCIFLLGNFNSCIKSEIILFFNHDLKNQATSVAAKSASRFFFNRSECTFRSRFNRHPNA